MALSHSLCNLPSMGRTVPIRRDGEGRLYNTERMAYVSLSDVADMLVKGLRITVEDATTGDDITSEVLDMLH
jgi:polyhydroxyalkanoate synthesis regulator protein